MTTRTGLIRGVAFAVIIAFALVIALSGLYFVIRILRTPQRRLAHLLCETDCQVLLNACRELSNRVTTGDLKQGTYWVRVDDKPKASQFQFPQVILDIEPVFVKIVDEGWVMLEMGGIPTFGVVAYAKDSKSGYTFQGDVELIPGLWYYDEDYSDEHPKWQKKIDALIQKGKMLQKEKETVIGNNKDRGP